MKGPTSFVSVGTSSSLYPIHFNYAANLLQRLKFIRSNQYIIRYIWFHYWQFPLYTMNYSGIKGEKRLVIFKNGLSSIIIYSSQILLYYFETDHYSYCGA